jgi:hypothetical protein
MPNLISAHYQGITVSFTDDGWFNATATAACFDKRLDKYLDNEDTKEYIKVLCEDPNTPKKGDLITTKRGNSGGTWMHPDLAVHFARWLDKRFAIWCDRQIRSILSHGFPANDKAMLRHETAASFKVMTAILQMTRKDLGKNTGQHHYMNEAKLINWALNGKFAGIDRDKLPAPELNLLARLEEFDCLQLCSKLSYEARKTALAKFAVEWRKANQPRLN